MSAMPPFKDAYVHDITAWKLLSDKTPVDPGSADIATEFAGRDAPKSKFLFTVSFDVDSRLGINAGNDDMARIVYACKSATRPAPNWDYQEVNAYNYRFKVARKIDYGSATVTFYDDNKNTALNIIRNYLMLTSPIARRGAGPNYYNRQENVQMWSSIGPLPNDLEDGLIRSLRVGHHYRNEYKFTDQSHQVVYYDYINPKIQTFSMEDLDMSDSTASALSITFVYDSVNIWYTDEAVDTFDGGIVTVGDLENIRT